MSSCALLVDSNDVVVGSVIAWRLGFLQGYHWSNVDRCIPCTARAARNVYSWSKTGAEEPLHLEDFSGNDKLRDLILYEILTDGIFADGPVTLAEANLLRAQYSAAGCEDVTAAEY